MPKTAIKILVLFLLVSCSSIKEKKQNKDYIFRSKGEKRVYLNAYDKSLKLWGVPFQEEYIPTKLGTAHVIVAGPNNGEAVVLLHGMDATSTMWYPNIKSLSKNNRVYAIDFLMEVGKSQSNEKSLSKEEIVGWYTEIFNHYKLNNFTLIGASKGGWLSTLLATQKDNKVGKLVLLSPAQTFQNIDQAGKASAALFLKIFPSKKKLDKVLSQFSQHPEKINSDYKRQYFLANKYAKSSSSFLQMQPFSDDDLKSVNIPVLVIIGDHDIVNSEESLVKAKKLLSNSKTATVKDAGHFLSIDQAPTVNKLILEFIK